MKSFTFRKNWNTYISEMEPERRNKAVVYVYDFVLNGNKPNTTDFDYMALIRMVEKDLARAAKNREKARQRREAKKMAQQNTTAKGDTESVTRIDKVQDCREYLNNPALYMFDGFMKYLSLTRDVNERLDLPDNSDAVSLMKQFREWAIKNNRLNEISKLNSFVGLFRHALPDFMPYVLIA